MKKILLALSLLFVPLTASASLVGFYQQQGQSLPNVAQRAPVAHLCGVVQNPWDYRGTAPQNVALESCLRTQYGVGGPMIGATISRPELFYSTNLTRGLAVGGSETVIYVATLPTETTGYMVVNPLSANVRELIKYTGVTTTGGNQLTGVTRGLAEAGTTGVAISDSRVAANAKRHSSGETVSMNNGRYEQLIIDVLNGLTTSSIRSTDANPFVFQYLPQGPSTTATNPLEFITLGQLTSVTSTGCADASTSVRGCVEKATNSEVEAGTATGATGAQTFVGADSWLSYADTHLNNSIDAGELVAARNILYVSSTGKHMIAHANVQGEVDKVDSVAFEAGCSGCFPKVYMPGSMILDAGLSLTPGGLVYLSDAGRPSETAGTIRKVIGIAYSANNWEFNPTIDTPSATPTANTIPIANASGTLAIGWYSGVTQSYTAGESIDASSAPLAVYVSSTDGRVYKTASGAVTTTFPFIGFAVLGENKTAGQSISVQFAGNVTGFTGMTTGSIYYVSTAGTVSSTAGTINYKIGRALSPTVLFIEKGSKVYSGTTSFSSTATTVITVGFTPSKVIINASNRSALQVSSNGSWTANGGNNTAFTPQVGTAGGYALGNAWYTADGGGVLHTGTVTSLTATGFTLSNTETSGADTVDLVWTASE